MVWPVRPARVNLVRNRAAAQNFSFAMASHAKIFHRDSAGTDAFTFDATMALPLADIKILRTLVAPFAKEHMQKTEDI